MLQTKTYCTDATVIIRLRSDSEKLLHSYPIRCEGFPTSNNIKGEFKWYRMNNTKNVDPSNNFQIITTTNVPVFHPNIEDSNGEIACQWVPDNNSIATYQPSNFARIGPLVKDPTILTDAQTMIDGNIACFKIDSSNSGVDQSTKQLKVDCKSATIMILETMATNKVKEAEGGEAEDTSSHHSPSLSSRNSTTLLSLTNRSVGVATHSPRPSLQPTSPNPSSSEAQESVPAEPTRSIARKSKHLP
ncbi:hypothetical protein RFI_31708 [Reticulomyxa filosa]|uniref:Uncharacterized protein n=1 Tax=Reticulomyxa filosa TaxID=46433 RepID=X6LVN0_RETFI|nr:hypothetical protein RFI_31708 [Reticulomyxa filosa]|eukprot:ETO05689.1 hypothetical protein RFI_31708 [Reticulomyxa filosa]